MRNGCERNSSIGSRAGIEKDLLRLPPKASRKERWKHLVIEVCDLPSLTFLAPLHDFLDCYAILLFHCVEWGDVRQIDGNWVVKPRVL
jgi:hypothetical protein